MIEIVAQLLGIVGMTMNILSFQRKEQKSIIFMQLIGSAFFAANYFLLGAMAGAMLNMIGIIRATVYWQRDHFRAGHILWVFGLSAAYIAVYILSFTVFGTKVTLQNLLVELLPVIGMVITTVGFYLGSARAVRWIGIFNSPLWLTYNIINFTIGGIICEVTSLCSITIGIVRHDLGGSHR